MRRLLVLVLIASCKGGGGSNAGSGSAVAGSAAADPMEDLSFKALEKRMAVHELLSDAGGKLDASAWPKGDVPGLDFTKETGNAIIVYPDSGKHADPITNAPAFKLFHVVDDPYLVATYSRGIGLDNTQDKATYRAGPYKPALELMTRAKYALLALGDLQQPRMDLSDKKFHGGVEKGVAVLYEIDSKKLLGGFTFEATSSDTVSTHTGNYTGEELDAVMHDFEQAARASLWKALAARFPSANLPTIVHLNSKE